jgi:ABC-type multidrug transport system fused ATPase/permease subunit
MTILFITYGFYLAPKEMVIGLFLLGILVIPLKLLTSSIHKTGEGLVVEWNRIHDILFLGLKNNFLLRVYDLIDQEVQKSRDVIDRYCKHQVSYAMTSAFLYSLPVVVGVLIISVITYVSLTYFNRPGAVLLAFFYVFIRIAQASSDSFNTLSLIRLNIPAFKKLYSWYIGHFILAKKETKIPSAELIQENVESIEFDKVTFGYDSSEKPVLDELSFKIVRGKMLLIKGESGSGKSTLLSILLGLNIPQSGNVLLNEKKNRLQKEKVAYVGPESYLIPGSVKENLMYGQGGERSDSEVWEALRLANVDLEIKKLPNGLAEHLNEFTQLSTGQKQRLAIARALLRKPDVLILDEATSNLDTETEAEIINQIKQIKKDFVTVVISHKNSFDAVSDICIELT